MAEEEEVVARTEKVMRIQRVFINLLDSYSSRNIGKVSGSGSEQDPQHPAASPQPQVPEPEPWALSGPLLREGPSFWAQSIPPKTPVGIQVRQAPHLEAQMFGVS